MADGSKIVTIRYTDLARQWRKEPRPDVLARLSEEAVAALSPTEVARLAAAYVSERTRISARKLSRDDERRATPGKTDPGYDFSPLNALAERYEAKLFAQWSAALLATAFTVDGVIVTWGSASVAQHVRRAEVLRRQAAGTVETAQRHELAVRQCDELGLTCLNEGMGAAA